MCESFELAVWVCTLVSMRVYFWDWFNEAFIEIGYPQQIYKTGNVRNETLIHSNLIHSLTALYVIRFKRLCTCLKHFYRFDSWRCELIFRIYKSWSQWWSPSWISNKSFFPLCWRLLFCGLLENSRLGTWESPIVMLNSMLTISGFKHNLNYDQNLLSEALSRGL